MAANERNLKASFPHEFKLAVDCCRSAFRDSHIAASPMLEQVDWPRFARLAEFHRIEGLAALCVADQTSAPDGIRLTLAGAAARIAARNLQASAECRTLLKSFHSAGVPLLFLKGLTIGALGYRSAMAKAAVDIDLLIDPADLRRAAELLRAAGYSLAAPRDSANDRVLTSWHRCWKESIWAKRSPRLQIDLHTRSADNPRLIPSLSAHSARQTVDVGNGVQLPTFADEELFAYLAVHGASSAWFRLKWIADLGGFLSGRSGEEIERLHHRSQELGAGRAAGQALLLADDLFGTLADAPGLRRALLQDATTRRLYRTAFRLLTREPTEPTDRLLGSLPIRWSQFQLLFGARFKLSELSGQVRRMLTRVTV